MLVRFAFVVLFAVGLSAQSDQSAHAPSVQQGYRIAGIVVNWATGQPVAGASVAIAPTTQGIERHISRSVITSSDGRFVFASLSRGKYSLVAAAHGFMFQGFERHGMYSTAVVTGPDLDSEHLVFRLQPDASIEGIVTDENNDPVQNAMARLFEQSREEGRQRTVPMNQGQTDDQGQFRIGHLEPGTYYLAVSARPWYAQNNRVILRRKSNNPDAEARAAQEAAALDVTYPLTFYPDSADSAGASPIVLHPGERVTADVVMRAVPSLHLRIRTSISGGAGGPGMVGFPRVLQRIFDGYLDPVFNAPESSVEPGVVDIAGLAPGHYVIEMPSSKGGNDKGANREGYREVDLAGDLEVNANDSSGFVSVGGSVLFEGAQLVPKGVAMQLSNQETSENFASEIRDKGQFEFEGMKPGRYTVALQGSGGYFLRKMSVTGAKLTGRTLEIGGSSSVHIAATVGRGVAQVDGVALRGGQPFSGAMIVLVPRDAANNSPLFRRDQSDSDGSFTLPNVVPGQYIVLALADGWGLEWGNPAVLQPYLQGGEAVQITGDGKLQIEVRVQ
ncbi:MAG: carboxypeptidase regulatory-like domain-containing protein [Candidatus Korobacteraceae bacterium]